VALLKEPFNDKGVQDKHRAQNSLPEMNGGMFMIVAATAVVAVFVMMMVTMLVTVIIVTQK
jgi:hypothetical protein